MPLLGRGLNPNRFTNLLNDFRHKITRERMLARLQEVKQEEVVALIKVQAEIKARYLLAVLDLLQPHPGELEGMVSEVRAYREMVEEIDKGVKAIIDGIVNREVPMPGLDHGPEMNEDIERALQNYIKSNALDEL
jgi:hypothetical protein